MKELANPNCIKCGGSGERHNGYFSYPCDCAHVKPLNTPWINVVGIREEEEKLREENDRLKLMLKSAESVTNRTLSRMDSQIKHYRGALRKIVMLNIPMPDEVFAIANNAIEEDNW